MKKITALITLICLIFALTACGGAGPETSFESTKGSDIDYMALVNKLNPLPEGWEKNLKTTTVKNSRGDEVEAEVKAVAAFEALKQDLEENDGVYIELDSARRSVKEQQAIMDDFTKEYGADYAKKTVAEPGYSEHHTGLALDLYLRIDGKDVYLNEEMVQHPEIWEKIHAKIADYGFILRYLEDKEHITGYGYEPWHIRYIDDPAKAKEITSKGITLEEFVAGKEAPEVDIDYGFSKIFTKDELKEAAVQIKCSFASWKGCELHSMKYAGDENNNKENLEWLNDLNEGQDEKYVDCVKFTTNFHSPVDEADLKETAWEPDKEYKDYEWWLARTADGGWDLVSWGYN